MKPSMDYGQVVTTDPPCVVISMKGNKIVIKSQRPLQQLVMTGLPIVSGGPHPKKLYLYSISRPTYVGLKTHAGVRRKYVASSGASSLSPTRIYAKRVISNSTAGENMRKTNLESMGVLRVGNARRNPDVLESHQGALVSSLHDPRKPLLNEINTRSIDCATYLKEPEAPCFGSIFHS